MQTKILFIDPQNPQKECIAQAAKLIAEGQLVAFPTETVYGLGGNAKDETAAERIYEAKGRPSDNPLIVHIADPAQLTEAARDIPPMAYRLAEAFWPGPLTMILQSNPQIPLTTTGGLSTVAVRLPAHPAARALIRESGCLIAAPSANLSGRPSPTTASHVSEDLSGRIPMILDGGPVGVGIESTIVDLTDTPPMILRPGYITAEQIGAVLGEPVAWDPALSEEKPTEQRSAAESDLSRQPAALHPKAPGMRYRHYAPQAPMWVVMGKPEAVSAEINRRIGEEKKKSPGKRIAVISSEETFRCYTNADMVLCIGSRKEEDTIARRLYDVLRQCDERGAELIFAESFEDLRIGEAVNNRLLKAAGHQLIVVP